MIIFLKRPLFSQSTILHLKSYTTQINLNLLSVLKNMPKEPKHITEAQKQRRKIKEKFSRYVPGKVTLQVLGTGAKGAPRALYLFTDQSRYLFNCGEGTQRLAHEHKMKLAKLEHIFITQPVWKNIGGLPGTALTIQDVGVPEITLHGPPGLDEIFVATKRFVVIRDLKIHMAECNEHDTFEDNVMKVKYVPLVRTSKTDCNLNSEEEEEMIVESEKLKETEVNAVVDQVDASTSTRSKKHRRRRRSSSGSNSKEETVDDDIDYYAHEHSGNRTTPIPISENSEQILLETKEKGISMVYICRLHPKPGALNLEKCVKMGVPPGPLLGKLKAGENIVLPDGNVVSSTDVCEPDDPGPLFIVVDCPTSEYLDSLMGSKTLKKHQSHANSDEELANIVVHFTPKEVVDNPRYKQWIDEFSPSTQHIMLNDFNTCMGSQAVHRIQYKLNLLSDEIFPLLGDRGTQTIEEIPGVHAKKKQKCDDNTENAVTCTQHDLNLEKLTVKSRPTTPSEPFIYPNTFCNYHLRPRKGLDRTTELKIDPKEYIEETMVLDGFSKVLSELKENLMQKKSSQTNNEYPKVLFLGTGSCIPNKTRNTSGILLSMTDSQNILLDCGEGTYGQIVRFFGTDHADKVLADIDAIYISHLHADHHIGLIGLLQGRRRAIENIGLEKSPAYLFAPNQIMTWLSFYNKCFETIKTEFLLVPNGELLYSNQTYPEDYKLIMDQLQMSDIKTCYVKHCPNAFGVAFTSKEGLKLTYSGDTMPTDSLVDLGENSDILIHEATMEDELSHEAIIKMHSTTSQAIEIGRKMKAKNIILTHFSQRYARLPRFNENFCENVGIAFDNMQVSLDNMPLLPKLHSSLKLMFAEHYEELENKAFKRQLKLERERSASRERNLKRKQSIT